MASDVSQVGVLAGALAGGWTLAPACVPQADCLETRTCTDEVPAPSSAGRGGGGGSGSGSGGSGARDARGGSAASGGSTPTGGAASGGAGGSSESAGTAGSGQGGVESGSAGDGGEAGSGGAGGGVGGVPVCDPSKSPSVEACLVSDEFAVFVSPLGSDQGSGAKAAPLLSLADAIELATVQKKVVVACGSEQTPFSTALALRGELDVRVVGGFNCTTWGRASRHTIVAPEERGPALTLDGVSGALAFENFEFRARDAEDGEGESSIAAVVAKSEGVAFTGVLLTAGKGGQGSPGEAGGEQVGKSLNGHDAMGEAGGGPRTTAQCGCDTSGGHGGDAEGSRIDGSNGLPARAGGNGGKGGTSCSLSGNGKDGANALPTTYAKGASSRGTLNGTTWQPAAGNPGETGQAGQGGGGGGGEGVSPGGAGGGGACGGCGGKGGGGGGGGGASIGLLLVNSTVTFQDSLIVSTDAGDGGDGGRPQPGQLGGYGGSQSSGGCIGGRGGAGAAGGIGGGGAGGISVGILYRGAAPSVDGVSISTGAPGSGGLGADSVARSDDGVDGDNPDTLAVDA